jgi:hypothetical protein
MPRLHLVAVALCACKGDGDGSSPEGSATFVPLETVAQDFDVNGQLETVTCDEDLVRDYDVLKFDQQPTGLSVFLDPDIGWIPCDGSVSQFDCRWGNAPSSTPGGTWNWALVGHSDGQTLEATLTLRVKCDGTGGGQCEECEIVAHVTGEVD